jgi:leucyl/phenylalanyl-tRNA--protein transferase
MRAAGFRLTVDTAFDRVIQACATSGGRRGNTWITSPMLRAYGRLHAMGICHSVEVWREERLAGGLYGISMGGLFAGESMFSRVRDASKVALVWLVERLRDRGCSLFDVQIPSAHLEQFGAEAVPRRDFLARLAHALHQPSCWPPSQTAPP